MERRLAAILAADVVGYSRLIRADEEGKLAALNSLRNDIIDPKLEHHGRIVKLMGDRMLVEFGSVVVAVRAAVETPRAVAEHNADLPKEQRIAPTKPLSPCASLRSVVRLARQPRRAPAPASLADSTTPKC